MAGTAWVAGRGLRFSGTSFRRFGLRLLATLEIRCIPTAARELKTGRGYLLGKRFLATCRAGCHIGLANFAHHLGLMAATCTFVIVNWHKSPLYQLDNRLLYLNPIQIFDAIRRELT